MRSFIEHAKLFIFDLDGTLYEDTDHFDYYADLLADQLPNRELQLNFHQDYEAMKAGTHVVQIGTAYDVENDLALTLNPMNLQVTLVQDWNGNVVDYQYPTPLLFNFKSMIAIGDGWWLPFVAAMHYGVSDTIASYNRTKEFMVTDQFQLTKTPGLKQGLLELKETKKLVLCTNSDLDDALRLLKELELDTIFEHILPSSMKPAKTEELFKRLLTQYDVEPHEAISIGDNFINEIAPALKLGMKAVYIHAKTDEQNDDLLTIPTLANVFA
ncbi:HAD family hydrolase [Bacillus sp. BGMRC 2118]|nr:HAD family hydrolase [Bacillus sp. BGMRC 2118]